MPRIFTIALGYTAGALFIPSCNKTMVSLSDLYWFRYFVGHSLCAIPTR